MSQCSMERHVCMFVKLTMEVESSA
jgi:hypothetical protein